jgi:hypothetical protein
MAAATTPRCLVLTLAKCVAHEVNAAALPGCPVHLADGLLHTLMGVADHEFNAVRGQLVVLLERDALDAANGGIRVGEDGRDVGAALDYSIA